VQLGSRSGWFVFIRSHKSLNNRNDIEKREADHQHFNDGKANHPPGQGPVTNGALNGNHDVLNGNHDVDPRSQV